MLQATFLFFRQSYPLYRHFVKILLIIVTKDTIFPCTTLIPVSKIANSVSNCIEAGTFVALIINLHQFF